MAGFAARSRGRCLSTLAACLGLFLTAFFAATLLPMQSEAALIGLLLADSFAAWALVAAASLGNVAGSVVNWIIGAASSVSVTGAGSWCRKPVSSGRGVGIAAMGNGRCC